MEISDVFMKVYKQNWIHIKVSNRLPPSRQQNKMFCVCIYIKRSLETSYLPEPNDSSNN